MNLTSIEIGNKTYTVDLKTGISLSITLNNNADNPNAFFANPPSFTPVVAEGFIGDTAQGGLLNFKDVLYNPHGNGTHTECVGHIAAEPYTLIECLHTFHFLAQLITVDPKGKGNDKVITKDQLELIDLQEGTSALIIRTLPNGIDKRSKVWSGSNPPYIHHEAVKFLVEKGIDHLLIDLPSVDREQDEGKLLAHKAFWRYPSENVRKHATITEMIYAPASIIDGSYFLNIQISPIAMDASSSNIVIYPLQVL